MHVPNCRVGGGFAVTPGTAWMVESGWRVLSYYFWKHFLIDIACWKVCLEPVVWVLIVIIIRQFGLLLHLIVFVVADVDHNRRVVA